MLTARRMLFDLLAIDILPAMSFCRWSNFVSNYRGMGGLSRSDMPSDQQAIQLSDEVENLNSWLTFTVCSFATTFWYRTSLISLVKTCGKKTNDNK